MEYEISFGRYDHGHFVPELSKSQMRCLRDSIGTLCAKFSLGDAIITNNLLAYNSKIPYFRTRNGVLEYKRLIKKEQDNEIRYKISDETLPSELPNIKMFRKDVAKKHYKERKYVRESYIGPQWRFDIDNNNSLEIEYLAKPNESVSLDTLRTMAKYVWSLIAIDNAEYRKLVEEIAKKFKRDNSFRGLLNMPKSFNLSCLKHKLIVSPKIDGETVIIICGAETTTIIANSRIIASEKRKNIAEQYLVGEMIDKHIIIFDNMIDAPYSERLAKIVIPECQNYAFSVIKTYSECKFDEVLAPYCAPTDGIVFTSMESGYHSCEIYKWKEPKNCTVDFIARNVGKRVHLYVYSSKPSGKIWEFGGSKYVLFDKFTGSFILHGDYQKINDGAIVECRCEDNRRMVYVRTRTDKATPNSYYIVMETLNNIITIDCLRKSFDTLSKNILYIKITQLESAIGLFSKSAGKSPRKILDIGIGKSFDEVLYNSKYLHTTAIDHLSFADISASSRKMAYICADFNKRIDYGSDVFDIVVMNFCIQYCNDVGQLMRGLKRHITSDSILIINVLDGDKILNVLDAPKCQITNIKNVGGGKIQYVDRNEIVSVVGIDGTIRRMNKLGFKLLAHETFGKLLSGAPAYGELSNADYAYVNCHTHLMFALGK